MAIAQAAPPPTMADQFSSTFSTAPQHVFAGPSRRRGRPPVERVAPVVTPADSAAGTGPAASTRTKNGCWSCRVRRKKCDESSANHKGVCKQCARLEIECLGWGAKRPEWMRDKDKVAAWKANVTKSLTEKGMIRGVPRTNPPAPPPFTYNPRGAHATVSSPDEATSPISPVTNYIPGAGPIPPAPKPQPPPKRNSSSKSAPSVPIPPSIPEPNGVVPTQPVSQESSDESDGDDFFFDDKLLMSGLDDPFPTMPSELIGEAVVESGLLDMNEIDVPPTLATDFDQSVGAFVQPGVFADVEEIVTPGVSAADSNNANYPAFDNGFGSVAPSVVFGPIAPYVQQNGMDAYSAYPNGEYANWSNYNGYAYSDNMVSTVASTMASTVSTPYLQSNGYGSPDSPPMLRSPTTGIEQDRLRNMLILYYFKHVRQMQYVFAGDVTTNVMLRHAQMDPQGVVSLALCSLAALHDSRMRIANGIMPNDQRARLPADKYYQKALTQLQGNKQRTGRLTDADATAALHFVSFWLFAGGAGDWPTALQIAGDWYEQSNLANHENPMRALLAMDENAKHASKTTMWMDIFSSISLCRSPRFLKLYRRLLQPHTSFLPQLPGGPQLENVMGCSDSIMLCLAEIADLACWKATQLQAGCLSTPELVRRGLVIEKDLRREGQALNKTRGVDVAASIWGNIPPMPTPASSVGVSDQMGGVPPAMVPSMDMPAGGVRLGQAQPLSPPSSPPLPSAILDGDELRRLVSDIFREAAILYLHTELSELRPNVPEIKRAVADTVNSLRKLPPSEYDRSLVFPLALAGCATDDAEMRDYVRCRIQQMSSAIGNCATAGQLVEYVWQRRDTSPAGFTIGWREAMAEINMTILLV